MKRILVTGGFGLVGSHLIERLLDAEHDVHVVDNLSSSSIRLLPLMRELAYPPNLTCYLCDVLTYAQSRHNTAFDEIYHLANPTLEQSRGGLAYQIIANAHAVTEMALRTNAKLVYVSTSYGDNNNGLRQLSSHFFQFQAQPLPQLEYNTAFLAAETSLLIAAQTRSLKAVVVRPAKASAARVVAEALATAMQTGECGVVYDLGSHDNPLSPTEKEMVLP